MPAAEEQWHFEVGAESSTITAKTWPVGTDEPLFPQIYLELEDARFSGRSFGFHAEIFDANGRFGASFDDVLLTTVCAQNKLVGDLDGDRRIAFSDFLILSQNFGRNEASYAQGDLDCNGLVEFADFLTLSANFGIDVNSNSSALAVPEPATSFYFLGLLVILCRQRRDAQFRA